MSIEIKRLPVSTLLPDLPPIPTGSVYLHTLLPSTTADGSVYIEDNSWALARDATTGDSASTSQFGRSDAMFARERAGKAGVYNVNRSFLYFDFSGIPEEATIISGTLRMHSYDYTTAVPPSSQYADSNVSVQQGTQAASLTTADFDSFTGSFFGQTTWKPYNVNYIDFDSAGITYLNSVIGSEAKLCLREYAHDYSNSAPPDDTAFYNGMFYREAETYDFYSSTYHREYIPFLHLYYRLDWEGEDPSSSSSTYIYALDGPTAFKGNNWNHDLRIARMFNESPTWSETRSATTASGVTYGDSSFMVVEAEIESPAGDTFSIFRSFMSFDLADVTNPHDITGATLRFYSAGYGSPSGIPKMDVFKGTFDYTISADDFDSFTGTSLVTAPASWVTSGNYVTFTLNSDGINYLKENVGKIVSFCLREYDHDVQDSAPVNPGDLFACYFYGTGQGADATYDPRLEIIYDTAS